jgi:hypothetical protein
MADATDVLLKQYSNYLLGYRNPASSAAMKGNNLS